MGLFDFKNDIDFMGTRRWVFPIIGVVLLACIIGVFKPGLRYGTDFVGGTEVEVALKQPVDIGQMRATVDKIGFEDPEVVQVEGDVPNRFLIRVKEVSTFSDEQRAAIEKALCLVAEDGDAAAAPGASCPEELRTTDVNFSPGGEKITVRYEKEVCGEAQGELKCPAREDIAKQLSPERMAAMGLQLGGLELTTARTNPLVTGERDNKVEFFFKSKGDQIMDRLRAELGAETVPDDALRIEWVGPKAGKQLRDAAIMSIALSLLFIMMYVAFRFDVRFAPGGIVALLHDVLICLGALVLFQREVTLSTVAALLTIVGFSINDTVVIYDRIRENLGKYRKMSFPKIINRSITETLGRTLKTSITTALAMTPFLIWGSGTIKDFAFVMQVGFVAGVFSTIYIASPLTEWIDRKVFGRSVRKKKRRVQRRAGSPSGPSEGPEGAGAAA